jgi:nitrous oxide reductase accessory protein NosL
MRAARSLALGLALLLFAAACGEADSGPARIAWGRDACSHCGMAISERRYAVQVRRGRDVARFDDFGCAALWLERLGPAGEAEVSEIWAMDFDAAGDTEKWLDARRAFFRPGQRTPMAYGFAAVAAARDGDVDFEAARRAILEHERERASGRDPRP